MRSRLLVSIVDDDGSVREALPDLLRHRGFCVAAFESAEDFLDSPEVLETSCLVLDVSMPGMSGPALQQELSRRRPPIPIIFITASRNAALREQLLANGAVDCLLKPFAEEQFADAVEAAVRQR